MIILSKYGNFCTWQAYFANMLIFSIYANLMQIMQNFAYIYANYAKYGLVKYANMVIVHANARVIEIELIIS